MNVVPPVSFMAQPPAPALNPLDPRNFQPTSLAPAPIAETAQQAPIGADYFEAQLAQYDAGSNLNPANQEKNPTSRLTNYVFGSNVFLFQRENFNDSVNISNLNTGSVNLEDAVAFDINLVARRQAGWGWEARYFGLIDETATNRRALTPGVPGSNSITRDTEIHNVEFNFVKQSKSRFLGMPVSTNETLFGARALQFEESLLFETDAFGPGFTEPTGNFPRTQNLLIGIQIGRRIDKQLFGKFGTTGFGKLGVYNNRSEVRNTGFNDTKDDVAFIGEADFAGTYTFNSHVRAKVGYRILAVTDLAIADSHLNTTPFIPATLELDNSDDLFLSGGYFGFEFVH